MQFSQTSLAEETGTAGKQFVVHLKKYSQNQDLSDNFQLLQKEKNWLQVLISRLLGHNYLLSPIKGIVNKIRDGSKLSFT